MHLSIKYQSIYYSLQPLPAPVRMLTDPNNRWRCTVQDARKGALISPAGPQSLHITFSLGQWCQNIGRGLLLLQSIFQTATPWVFVELDSRVVRSAAAQQSEQKGLVLKKINRVVSALRREVDKESFLEVFKTTIMRIYEHIVVSSWKLKIMKAAHLES